MIEVKQVPEEKIPAHLEFPVGFAPKQYEPTIIKTKNGTEYVILEKYIAGNLRQLLEICHALNLPLSNGDWWDDALTVIPKDWLGNGTVEGQVKNYNLWLKIKDCVCPCHRGRPVPSQSCRHCGTKSYDKIDYLGYIDVNNVSDNQDVYNRIEEKINEIIDTVNVLLRGKEAK